MSRVFQDFGFIDRATMPDVYPRPYDPLQPPAGSYAPAVSAPGTSPAPSGPVIALTPTGTRPTVTQKGMNFALPVPVANSVPLTPSRLEVDGFLIDNPSTSTQSVWLGFGSGVAVGTGIEIQPGIPYFQSPTNFREQWELQRVLEQMAAIMAMQAGVAPLSAYAANRVTLDAGAWYLIAGGLAQFNVSIMLFLIPEQQ